MTKPVSTRSAADRMRNLHAKRKQEGIEHSQINHLTGARKNYYDNLPIREKEAEKKLKKLEAENNKRHKEKLEQQRKQRIEDLKQILKDMPAEELTELLASKGVEPKRK